MKTYVRQQNSEMDSRIAGSIVRQRFDSFFRLVDLSLKNLGGAGDPLFLFPFLTL